MSLLRTKDSDVNTLTTNGETRNTHIITQAVSVNSTLTPGDFADRLEDIAVNGSGIPSALWKLNTGLLLNEEIDPGGDVSHPLYEALGWHFARFSYRANEKSKEFGIALSGDWQVILPDDTPKRYQYRAPKQAGNRAWFPLLGNDEITAICTRYGIPRDSIGADYWEDFKRSGIPLHPTEGAKKALAIIGQGYLACSVYGQTCLHSPDLLGWKTIHIAIDQDYGFTSKGESKATNNRISKLSGAHKLRKNGATVLFIEWSHRDGKGADDLLVNSPEKFHEAFNNPLKSIRNQGGKLSQWSIDVNQNYLELDLDKLGKAVLIRSPKGTGKSELLSLWIAPYIENGHKILGITHRVSLGQACGDRWGLPWIDEDRRIGQGMICIHSMHSQCKARFNPDDWYGAIVLIDELTQVLRDLVYSKLLDEHRAEILSNIKAVLAGASKFVGMDADICDECVALLKALGIDPTIVVNRYSPPLYPVTTFDKPGDLLADLLATIAEGGKALVLSDSQKNTLTGDVSKKKAGGKFSSQALEKRIRKDYPHLKVLRVDAETLADKNHPAFQCLRYEGGGVRATALALQFLIDFPLVHVPLIEDKGRVRLALLALEYDVIIASPSINTGIDLSGLNGHFAGVWGFFNSGTLAPPDLSQFLARLRDPLCPRKICVKTGFNRNLLIGNGATSPRGLVEGCHSTLRASLECLSFTHDRTTIDASFLDYWAKMGAVSNGYSFDYRESFYQFLRDEGHTLTGSEQVQAIDDRQAEIALEIAEERAKLVRDAEDITVPQAEALERKESLTQAEQAQLDKHRIQDRYGQAVTEELQLLDNTTGYSSLRLGWYLTNTDAATESDRKLAEDLADKSWLPTTAKRSVMGKVKALMALDIPKFLEREEFSNDDPQVNELLTKALECSVQIKNLLGVTVTDKTTPIALMRELGKKIGRKLELVRRSGNDRFYRYAPTPHLTQSIYRYWDDKAKTVSNSDTKCVTSGNKITPIQPSSDAIWEEYSIALERGDEDLAFKLAEKLDNTESEKTVSSSDTKCVTSGNKITPIQPSSDAIWEEYSIALESGDEDLAFKLAEKLDEFQEF